MKSFFDTKLFFGAFEKKAPNVPLNNKFIIHLETLSDNFGVNYALDNLISGKRQEIFRVPCIMLLENWFTALKQKPGFKTFITTLSDPINNPNDFISILELNNLSNFITRLDPLTKKGTRPECEIKLNNKKYIGDVKRLDRLKENDKLENIYSNFSKKLSYNHMKQNMLITITLAKERITNGEIHEFLTWLDSLKTDTISKKFTNFQVDITSSPKKRLTIVFPPKSIKNMAENLIGRARKQLPNKDAFLIIDISDWVIDEFVEFNENKFQKLNYSLKINNIFKELVQNFERLLKKSTRLYFIILTIKNLSVKANAQFIQERNYIIDSKLSSKDKKTLKTIYPTSRYHKAKYVRLFNPKKKKKLGILLPKI